MLKSITFSLLSFMLIISILAPSIAVLCDAKYDNVIVMDVNEEENNKKELEQKFDKKELFFSSYTEKVNLYFTEEITKSQTALLPSLDFSNEIVLPPPEKLV